MTYKEKKEIMKKINTLCQQVCDLENMENLYRLELILMEVWSHNFFGGVV